MPLVLRWGRSAYETDLALALEQQGAEELGLRWVHEPLPHRPKALASADALVVPSSVRVDATALEALGGNLVLTTTSGFDHIDLEAAQLHGVQVARLPQARRDAVVDHTVASLLYFMRRLPQLSDASRRGRWARGDLPALGQLGLRGFPVLVVGLGVIGTRVAKVLQTLGARVLGVDPRGVPPGVQETGLDEGLGRCRALTLHCDLNPTSRGLLTRSRLKGLAAGAIVLNTARGPILDLQAAVDLARAGHLGGLSVDVFPQEPWAHLIDHPRILMTPHAAGYTTDLGEKVARAVIDALRAWVTGDTVPHRVI